MSGVVLAVALAIGRNLLPGRLPGEVWGAGSCGGNALNRARFAAEKTPYNVWAAFLPPLQAVSGGRFGSNALDSAIYSRIGPPDKLWEGGTLPTLVGGLFGCSARNKARFIHRYAPD